jgi:hypothetical protein
MDASRLRIDLFAFALGALTLLSAFFYGTRNGAALIMCALCFAALLVARLAGFSNLALVPLALGIVALLWIVWIDPPAGPVRTGAIAHGVGGLLVGWALAEWLRGRLTWPAWALTALAGVFALTVLWEFGEYFGDRLLATSLVPSARDSAIDIFFGALGGATAVALAGFLPDRAAKTSRR